MSNVTDQIKDRLPIEDVVGMYVKLERSGKNLRGKCPFHNEKTPSFFVSPDRGSYYCFGCGAKGDIFSFVENFEGIDFKGALKILAPRAGVELKREDPKKASERDRTFEVLEEATAYFEVVLRNNKEALEYLKKRGLSDKTVGDFRIGYASKEWEDLKKHLIEKGFTEKILDHAGLVVLKEGGGSYDRFRGRVMFPIMDSSGRVVAFSGREYPENKDKPGAKYVNSPETEIFHKKAILYGFDKAKGHIRKYGFSIVVEGQMDLLMCHQAGYKNTVAGSGTALTNEHFKILKRISNNIVLSLDADSAGVESSKRSAMEALALGMDVKVAALPPGSDPADLIKKDVEEWKMSVKNSKHIIDYIIELTKESKDDERTIAKKISAETLPFVKVMENKIDQAHFVKKISEELGVSEESVYEELSKISLDNIQQEETIQDKTLTERSLPQDFIENRIVAMILWQKSLKEPNIEIDKIKKRFEDILEREMVMPTAQNEEELIFEAENFFGKTQDLSVVLDEMFINLEKRALKEKMLHAGENLKVAEVLRKRLVELEKKELQSL